MTSIQEKFGTLRNRILTLKLKSNTKEKIQPHIKTILIVLLLGFVAFVWQKNQSLPAGEAQASSKSVDTFIPAGYVLVPVQISNAEALDSMIAEHGVVDLFVPDSKRPGKSRKVAEHIKILRAPLNPTQFAVLAKEEASSQLVHYEGAYFAIVQNPKTNGTQLETIQKRKVSSRLIMEDIRDTR